MSKTHIVIEVISFCEKNIKAIKKNVFFLRIEKKKKENILPKQVFVCSEVSHVRPQNTLKLFSAKYFIIFFLNSY